MAEKGFGVKEVNLIGASGTPTITSPNNLNLNANNDAISTNVSIGGTLTVTGNVSVGGTLTYEDVTNIDSVGLITAREGIKIPDDKYAYFGSDNDLEITHSGSNGNINNKTGDLVIRTLGSGDDIFIDAVDDVNIRVQSTDNAITCIGDGAVTLHYNGNSKLATTNTGVSVTGTLAATAVTGDGSGVTSLPAATPTNSDIQVVYTVTANGASAYRFAGNGVVSTADNPDLYFIRGKKYRFVNNSGGSHPFQIRESSGGTAYSTGVTNNGAASGNIDFAPTFDSPAQLVYQCTSHGGMVGNIYLRGGNGNETNVGVTTFAATGSNPFIQQWRLTSNKSTSSSSSDISANLEVVDSGGYGGTGGTMTESSGVFTFPSTGIYLIMAKGSYSASGGATSNYNEMDLHTTTDGSTFNRAAIGWCYIASGGYGTAACDFMFDVTNTSTHKVKFRGASASSNAYLTANTNDNQTHFTFMRIAAT